MSVLLILGRKYTLAASRAQCCPLVIHVEYAQRARLTLQLQKRRDRQTDGRTDGRQTDALRLPL